MRKALFPAALGLFVLAGCAVVHASDNSNQTRTAVLWIDPGDVAARNLFYGAGGPDRMPEGPFTFLKEDLDGTNPKFDITDRNGIHWKVKLGVEARPEVAAARLVWAVGYFAQENYFVPRLQVQGLPDRLKRGQEYVAPDGLIYGARLKRSGPGAHKAGSWRWRKNPFSGSRELNGLRVMMALISNPDLKNANNGIYREEGRDVYMVSDLGCSFSRHVWPFEFKGNLESYRKAEFIRRIRRDSVDFDVPIGPATVDLAHLTWYGGQIWLRWIVKNIPIVDARWIGGKLAALSPAQLMDAFRAAGYQASEARGFTDEILKRIAQLNAL